MKYFKRSLSLIVIALFWEMAARIGLVRPDVLPPLSQIFVAWLGLLRNGELVSNGIQSLARGAAGVSCAIVLGAAIGISMAAVKPIRLFFRPLMEVFYPVPKSALIPVTALWLGLGDLSKVVLIAMGCILPVAVGAYNGARGSERVLIWSAQGMGASKLRTVIDVLIPSALPELLNGIRTALALSFILLVSSELIVAKNGLGYLIGFFGSAGNYAEMFAVILTVATLGLVVDRTHQLIIRSVLSWRE
jgi:NitT/TauT family transport system permease protein